MSNDIKFEIKKHYGILAESTKGWTKELNIVKVPGTFTM